jgi:long-chain acyl-CoA synthetase
MSSGTMNTPKFVELTYGNVAAQLAIFERAYGFGANDRILNPLPLHFTDGMFLGPICTLFSGATLYRPREFRIEELEELMRSVYRDRITHFIVVPTILSLMTRLPASFDDAFETEDFRYIRSSGDRLPEALWRSFQERFKVSVFNAYGLSESVCEALYCGPDRDSFKLGTIGRPVGCEIRIVGEQGEPLSVGETGELQIRGPIVAKGYLGQQELTDETFVDGWLRTGDHALVDDEGFVCMQGRKKALIISGGVNIHPQEIVDALLEHPLVGDAFALGLPDRDFGETVGCAVVPMDGHGAGELDEIDIIDFCRERLAQNKLPRRVIAVEEIPRNAAGKVVVSEVAELFEATGRLIDASEHLEEEVISVAASVLNCKPSQLSIASEPDNTLGWDSLAHITMIAAVEKHFGIRLSARDILAIGRLEHLVQAVEQRTSRREG